jgi:hypothetical protein
MPFAFLVIGLSLVITGANDTYKPLGNQLLKDFTGKGNFTYWVVAIGAIGAIGYFQPFRDVTRYFMGLVVLAMFLAQGNPKNPGGGFFEQFKKAIQSGPQQASNVSTMPTNTAMTGADALKTGDALLTAASVALA